MLGYVLRRLLTAIPVMGIVKGGRVQPAHPEDIAGDKAMRIKPKG